MTPSEKKARESLLSDASYLLKSVDHQYSCACETCRQSQVERVASALDEAERQGFERAKELSKQIFLNDRGFYKPWDLIKRGRVVEEIENLRYEEA